MPGASARGPEGRTERQRRYWQERYQADPALFGDAESSFARWCVPRMRRYPSVRDVVELGCGYGRDARYFADLGFRVVAVELALPGSRSDPAAPVGSGGTYELVQANALEFLESAAPASADVVYSNMFYNMDLSEEEHRALFASVRRVLRSDGLHLYSVRSTSDPWYGRGRLVGPDRFEPAPDTVPLHFFSINYADRLSETGFAPIERTEVAEGEEEFPIRLLYVADRAR